MTGTIKKALDRAWREIKAELRDIPIQQWNESVFRYYFIRSLLRSRNIQCQTEWNHADLFIKAGDEFAVVEFKFLVCNWFPKPTAPFRRKGSGPGQKNFTEFCQCIKTLREATHPELETASKYVILAYVQHKDMKDDKNSYDHWYSWPQLRGRLDSKEIHRVGSWQHHLSPIGTEKLVCSLFLVN